jgi:hypothetical protein
MKGDFCRSIKGCQIESVTDPLSFGMRDSTSFSAPVSTSCLPFGVPVVLFDP